MEEDADVHEFVPWSHFSPPDKSRWPGVALGVVLAIMLTSGGFLLWDQPASLAPLSTSLPSMTTSSAVTSGEPVLLSEHDLLPVDIDGATTTAEEFVIGYFTRSGDSPTYVEWARAIGSDGAAGDLRVSVRYRLLADDPYQRMPTRESDVTMRLTMGGWLVVGLPTDTEAAAILHEVSNDDYELNEYGFRVAGSP